VAKHREEVVLSQFLESRLVRSMERGEGRGGVDKGGKKISQKSSTGQKRGLDQRARKRKKPMHPRKRNVDVKCGFLIKKSMSERDSADFSPGQRAVRPSQAVGGRDLKSNNEASKSKFR